MRRLPSFPARVAARGDERVAVGDLQLRQSPPRRCFNLDLVGLRQSHQQRLRLGDLRHVRRQRKSFERGGENGVGTGGAAGRSIKLGQRQGRAQFEAARALPLRDRDSGQEGFFRGSGVGGVALDQDFAAHAMQFCFECAIAHAVARRQRFVEDDDSAVGIACPRFRVCERDFQ